MKRITIIVIAFCCALLLSTHTSYAQLGHIVMGKVLNPDASEPGEADIEIRAYLTKDISDTCDKKYCGPTGGWAIDTIFDFDVEWQAGDTLYVIFKNVSGDEFDGATYWMKYKTTNISPEQVTDFTLPVELTMLEASVERTVTGDEVRLDWQTVSETNNLGFEIQKSMNGREFAKIGFVSGAGSTSTPHAYKFMDKDINVGTYFYRLKQIDTDGSFDISNAVQITVTPPETYELGQNYPNPFNPSTQVVIRLKESGHVRLIVYDILGREVATIVDQNMKAGTHKFNIQADNWTTGVYFYSLQTNHFNAVKKMLLLR